MPDLNLLARENPEINKDLSDKIADSARVNIADHFIGKEYSTQESDAGKQEQLTSFVSDPAQEVLRISDEPNEPYKTKETEETVEIDEKEKSLTEIQPAKTEELEEISEIPQEIPTEPDEARRFASFEKGSESSHEPEITPITDEELQGPRLRTEIKKNDIEKELVRC